ncbi:helix-turn-helix transcriptional regulator [Agrobacterium vitis]|uniref:helix-turn-helix transcriptional regulator n=1 Tax=Allorhizobium ampelinum TaxID=3025782 RepID=UPI001F480450|nr:helix-turn-helix transcriptional regulator [Allorhizobium ampelinum]MCF1470579.1 helix-turn-helix transcriptional regulator [Allorhizobium ampelinum]
MHTYLYEWRRFRKLGQKQLASAAGVGLQHVSNIERGRVVFTSETLHRLAAALGCTTTELVAINPLTYGGDRLARVVRNGEPEQLADQLDQMAAIFAGMGQVVRYHPERLLLIARAAQRLADHSRKSRTSGTGDN